MCALNYALPLKFEKETDIIWISIDYQTEPTGDTPLCKDGEETGNPYLDATNILIITYNGLTMPHHLILSHNTLNHTISQHMRDPSKKA